MPSSPSDDASQPSHDRLPLPAAEPDPEPQAQALAQAPAPSPTGSKRSVDSAGFDELTTLAKASAPKSKRMKEDGEKNTEQVGEEGDEAGGSTSLEWMVPTLTCNICTDLFQDPVQCMPCQHKYCGSCIAQWLISKNTCPSCRTKVAEAKFDFNTSDLLDGCYKNGTKGFTKRSDEEIAECRKIYKPRDVIPIGGFADDDDEDDDDDEYNDNTNFWLPCPSCPANNPTGYQCPQPIVHPQTLPHDVATYQQHRRCTDCDSNFPMGWREYKCDHCGDERCCTMYMCPGRGSLQEDFVMKFEDFKSQNLFDRAPIPVSGGHHLPVTGTLGLFKFNFVNDVELKIMLDYCDANNIKDIELSSKVLAYMAAKDSIRGRPVVGYRMCKICLFGEVYRTVLHWWIEYKEEVGNVDSRPQCWYGHHCRTQHHNAGHASKLSHACNAIPEEDRVNNGRRPRDPNRVWNQVVLNAGPGAAGSGAAGPGHPLPIPPPPVLLGWGSPSRDGAATPTAGAQLSPAVIAAAAAASEPGGRRNSWEDDDIVDP